MKIAIVRVVAVDRIHEDRLAEPQLAGDGDPVVHGDRVAVEEDAERVATAAVGPEEDAQDVQLGHGHGSGLASGVIARAAAARRASATRWMATTLIASVIRPSNVIARTSSNGDPAQRQRLGRLGIGLAVGETRGQVEDRDLVGHRVREDDAGELVPLGGIDAGLLAKLALGADERVLAVGDAAFGDLPGVVVEGVAVLADEQRRGPRRRWRRRPRRGSRSGRRRRSPGCRRVA